MSGYGKVRLRYEGKVFKSRTSGEFEVIKYEDAYKVLIKFLSTGSEKVVSMSSIRSGSIRDKTRASVQGKGINDANYPVENKLGWKCPLYSRWVSMLTRCYGKSYLENYPSYSGCIVCEEWLSFSNFKQWIERLDWEGQHLDKDILGDGKIYSPENCIFIHPDVNTLITEASTIRGIYPLGVCKDKDKRVVKCRDPYLGKAVTIRCLKENECVETIGHTLWKTYKKTIVVRMWLEGKIDNINVYERLMQKYSYTGDRVWLEGVVKSKLIKQGVDIEGVFELIEDYGNTLPILPI